VDLAPPRGTADLLPPTSEAMLGLSEEAHRLANLFGYRYVETPAFEHTEVVSRSSGEASDIVTKEMYTFEDKGGRSLTLRPEATAPIVRAYLAHRHDLPSPFKAYALNLAWRHNRPQAGRLREFRVFDVEVVGAAEPGADVEVIALGDRYLRGRGLSKLTLLVNSIGDEACGPAYRERLTAFLEQRRDDLDPEARERVGSNPLRVFDSKDERTRRALREAPVISDHLCDACSVHFEAARAGLAEEGIAFEHDARLVRGLDYYMRTVFEFVSHVLPSAQGSVCSGGRYDGLAEVLGGAPTPGTGFGMGLDRVLMAMRGEDLPVPGPRPPSCFVVTMGDEATGLGRDLVRTLRATGVSAVLPFGERPLRAQLKMADRAGAEFAALIGEREVSDGTITVRRLADGVQKTVPSADVPALMARLDG
jgi:histidyl-tRNA synthetase